MKFELGEIAVVRTCPSGREWNNLCPLEPGDEVEVKQHHAISLRGDIMDYGVMDTDGALWSCNEHMLRKRRPPEEPAEDEFQEELNHWLNKEKVTCLD